MKCKICSASVEARYYGQHLKSCRKIQRDLSFFAAPPREPEPKLESKCYPIGGVAVKFPYKPYPVQVGCENVISCTLLVFKIRVFYISIILPSTFRSSHSDVNSAEIIVNRFIDNKLSDFVIKFSWTKLSSKSLFFFSIFGLALFYMLITLQKQALNWV